MSEWISVEDECPPSTLVLVIDALHPAGQPIRGRWCHDHWEWPDGKKLILVTHWMPLPPPPGEQG